MIGNVGQSNYCAANALLDAMTFSMKQAGPLDFNPMTLMWGAVAGLGMRWKAFGEKDVLLQAENSAEIMLDWREAKEVLTMMIIGVGPEWVMANKADEITRQYMTAPNPSILGKASDPWRLGKGGGELSRDASWEYLHSGAESPDEIATIPSSASRDWQRLRHPKTNGSRIRPRSASKNAWLFEGRRVQTYGLERSPHMNNIKGTLIAEVEEGRWQIRLDGDHGEKKVGIQNLMTLTGKPLLEYAGHPNAGEPGAVRPLEEYCIAGTWDDWLPHDMDWDSSQLCFVYDMNATTNAETSFAICRGKAGSKKWKTRGQNTWIIQRDNMRDRYQIRLFINAGGSVKKVDWKKVVTS